jgi:CBS domain-containing protein
LNYRELPEAKSLRVAEAMRTNIVTVEEHVSVAEASLSMCKKGRGCAIILRQGKPFGIITERDVTCKVAGKGLDPKDVSVAGVMSTSLMTIDPDADVIEAAKIIKKHKIRRLIVVREGALRGILTAADISRNLENYMDEETRNILRYLWSSRYSIQEG